MIINAAYKLTLSADAYKISAPRPTFKAIIRRKKVQGKIVVMPVGKEVKS